MRKTSKKICIWLSLVFLTTAMFINPGRISAAELHQEDGSSNDSVAIIDASTEDPDNLPPYNEGYPEEFTIGGIIYEVNRNGTVSITGHMDELSGNLVIPTSVTNGGHSYAVTEIADHAFSYAQNLTGDLVIPDGVTRIGNDAFNYCTGFDGNIVLPKTLRSIGDRAFYFCEGLTGDLYIPRSVRTIGSEAFYWCSGFDGRLIFEDRRWTEDGKNKVSSISIGEAAFRGCYNFHGNLVTPNATYIGDKAFAGCYGFSDELYVNYARDMGNAVFMGCSNIKKVTNKTSWPIDLNSLGPIREWRKIPSYEKIDILYNGQAVRIDYDYDVTAVYDTRRSYNTVSVNGDTYTVSWNGYVRYDGRKHYAAGVENADEAPGMKDTVKKVYDVNVVISKNNKIISPGDYTVKVKSNKNATMMVDPSTGKLESKSSVPFKIKFKGAENKDANKEFKYWTFSFRILPAMITEKNVKLNGIKRIINNSVRFSKAEFTPSMNGISSPKPLKMKYSKNREKTDYTAYYYPENANEIYIKGRNNYYGTAVVNTQ